MRFLLLFLIFVSTSVWAIPCDCEVKVYSPLTGSHRMEPIILKRYELESFSTTSLKSQKECRQNCHEKFESDMPVERLRALLVTLSERLIQEQMLGFNCTGLTTLKYPVRVKASLGPIGLGNVTDLIETVSLEENCF